MHRFSASAFRLRFLSAVLIAGTFQFATENAAIAKDASLRLGLGGNYSSGNYGLEVNTDIIYVPLTARLDWDRFRFRVSVPWIQIDGPGGVVGGDGPIIIEDGVDPVAARESGIGDITVSTSVLVLHETRTDSFVELVGKVKIPVADKDRGLGTGEFDYTVQFDFFGDWGRFTPFASIGYRIFGGSEEFDLNNTFLASVGGGWELSERTSIGLLIDYREATTDTSSKRLDVIPYFDRKLNASFSLNVYGTIGLANGSPDYSIGYGVSYDF